MAWHGTGDNIYNFFEVKIFWKDHKNETIFPFVLTLLKMWKIVSNFVAFSQYVNFTFKMKSFMDGPLAYSFYQLSFQSIFQ